MSETKNKAGSRHPPRGASCASTPAAQYMMQSPAPHRRTSCCTGALSSSARIANCSRKRALSLSTSSGLGGSTAAVESGGIGDFGGDWLEQPRQWLGAQWAGLFLGVPSCPEPPGASRGGPEAEAGHRHEEGSSTTPLPPWERRWCGGGGWRVGGSVKRGVAVSPCRRTAGCDAGCRRATVRWRPHPAPPKRKAAGVG
jgi:hypothetical protein